MSNEEINDFKEEENINDSNNSRLLKKCKIYNKIYNNINVYMSKYIFYPSLFDGIKDESIDLLMYKLELLCIDKNIENVKKIDDIENTEKIQYVDNIEIIKSLNIKLL